METVGILDPRVHALKRYISRSRKNGADAGLDLFRRYHRSIGNRKYDQRWAGVEGRSGRRDPAGYETLDE